jgi:two-component system, chemotaxis family, CheB/CheR fusion protein
MNKGRQRRNAAKDVAAQDNRTGRGDIPLIVAGIGASTGGLKSLQELFAKMPSGHGVAFVVIQHLYPSQENLTDKLIADHTALAVVEATDGMAVLPDRIHVLPADKFLNISECRLTLQEPVYCNGLRMPIDHFFCSLAADQRGRACGIVLSGGGSDGTLGLSEIRAAGGRTLVEDPGTAEVPQMPQSAIDAGLADTVLPADAMAAAIVALAGQATANLRSGPSESPEFDANLRAILDILRAGVGHDFRCYKPNTLVRRIRRRMTLAKVTTFSDYTAFLQEHPEEVALLQKDLLIGVTEFFRQPQAWELLEEKVIVPLLTSAQPGSEIRVWVPGCSTGQEVYTLAMLLAERVENSGKKVGIQIFATDSDTAALAVARSGSYSKEEIGENVSPERLKRFFERKDSRYQVLKNIREQVVFAPQNLTADPPFSRLDLISCRNLLIYLDPEVQKKIIALFHFALREGGFLFLGTAETVGDREDLFEPISKKWRIYRRIGVGRRVDLEIPVRPASALPPATGKIPAAPLVSRMSLASTAQQMLLDRFAPACVIIDRKLQVLYVHGSVEDFLTFPPGELTTQVVDMAREGLRARLRGAIGKCLEINRPVSVTARVRRGEKSVPVKATATPLRYPRETDGLLLITFEEYRVSSAKSRGQAQEESDVHQLADELKVTREELQSTIEQLENSNDQLKASNEEVTAANEELQSANEEMETSKEELQSLNEELNTINARLQENVDALEGVNNDLFNLLSSTSIATVFLDKELKVRRYTPASTRLFSLIPSDVGRPIADVLRRFTDGMLLDDARRVLADLTPLSKEIQADDGRWYIRRTTPYRTQDDRIEGVVITFVDVCDLKETEGALRRKQAEVEAARTEAENEKRRLEAVMEALPVGMAITDAQGGNINCNSAFEQVWGGPRPPAQSVHDYAAYQAWWVETGKPLVPDDWASARAVRGGESVVGQLIEIRKFDGTRAFVINSASPIRDAAGQVIGSAVAIQDITELRRAQEEAARLASFPILNPQPVVEADLDGNVFFANPSAERLFPDLRHSGPDHPWLSDWKTVAEACRQGCESLPGREVFVSGQWYHQAMYYVPQVQRVRIYAINITERKRIEESLRDSEARFKLLSETAGRLLAADDPQGIVNELCRDVMAHLDCQAFFNFLVDEEAGRLHLNAYAGIPAEDARKIEWLDYGVAVCGCAARDREPIVASHIFNNLDPRTELVKSFGIQAYACHPLIVQGRLIGTLSFGARNRPSFSSDDLALMKTVTDQVATAMERMRLIKELQRSRDQLEVRVQERTAELASSNQMLQEEITQRLRLIAAVEQAGEGIAITDPSGVILYVNPAFERISDSGKQDLLGKSYGQTRGGEEQEEAGKNLHGVIPNGGSWSGKIRRRGKDGQPRELDVTFAPIRDGSGRVINYLAVERDVTQEIRLQQHLRQMQKIEALGTLAGGIAHDFNNLLNPIFINTELVLLDAPLEPHMRSLLEMALKAAERGRDLVKQIITFSRQKEKERRPTLAEPLIKEALKFLRASLPTTLEIRENIQKESGFILADPTQIHQVVMNLCSNAAYAMREKGGVLGVSLAETEVDAEMARRYPDLRPGPYLRLTVTDTGTGMTGEVLERAFDPFFTTKKPGEGSGMGLAVVDGIVKDHGGAITIYTEAGKGCTFNVFFPRMKAETPGPDVSSEPLATGHERILLVDDEETQVQSVRKMLERLGYRVAVKTNSEEALALFRNAPQTFDLVITDQTMPRMTGVNLAAEILRTRPDIPVILCTGFSEMVDANGAKELGVREFLMKPFSVREMAESIRRALGKKDR